MNFKIFWFLIAFFTIFGITATAAGTNTTAPRAYHPKQNVTSGVCELEVP